MCSQSLFCTGSKRRGECYASATRGPDRFAKSSLQPTQLPQLLRKNNLRHSVCGWCREGESNPQGTKYRRILSPLRLPVPPSRLFVEVLVSTANFGFTPSTPQTKLCRKVCGFLRIPQLHVPCP